MAVVAGVTRLRPKPQPPWKSRTALEKYSFIPEAVFQTISCSTLKTQVFDTPIGSFVYGHLKSKMFFGYKLEKWREQHYKIAEPEKALIDYLYLHSEVRHLSDLESLRWNAAEISEKISLGKLKAYEDYICSGALTKRLKIFKEYLNANT